jgi:dihydrodipicolinate synthase/N-acetylneuraminate lyase
VNIIISDIVNDERDDIIKKIDEMMILYNLEKLAGISYNDDVMCRLMMEHIDFIIHQDMEYFRKYMEVMGEVYKILIGEEESG